MNGRRTIAVLAMLLSGAAIADDGPDGSIERKFHPGHYVALGMADDDAAAIRRVLRPGVVGIQKRYRWRDLEPSVDVYDFSSIAADLELMTETGSQLVVFIADKSFNDERITPRYLWDRHTLPIRSPVPGKGYVSKRWDPFVVARFNKLLTELGRRFDAEPRFEGVALQESAIGVEASILDQEGYSATAYRDALIETLATARRAMPESQIFWYMNYLAQGQKLLDTVCAAAARDGIVLGGPDALPDSAKLQKHVYPLLREQRNTTVLFTSAQNDSFRHERAVPLSDTKYWTPLEIFEFARDGLGVRYLFWNDVRTPRPADSYGIDNAYPVIAANPQFNTGLSPQSAGMP